MMSSGILLGKPKTPKKLSNTSSATLTPDAQATATIKLFIEDLASRLKSLLKKRKSKHTKLFVSFFSQLSTEPAPLETLSALQIDIFSDFVRFLEKTHRNLLSSNPKHKFNVYQLLTENLDATADFISQLLIKIEDNESALNTIQRYLSRHFSSSPSSQTLTDTALRSPSAVEKKKSHSSPRIFRKGKRIIYYYKDTVNGDFGFNLSVLSSFFPTSTAISSQPATSSVSHSDTAQHTVSTTPAIRAYFNKLALFSRNIVAEKSYPSIIADAMEKLANSTDVFSDLALFTSLPGITDFIDFSKTLNDDAVEALGEELLNDIARHLCDTFASESAQPLLASYLSTPLTTEIDTVLESLKPVNIPTPEEEPLPTISLDKLTEEIAFDSPTAPPTESDYIQFAIHTLRKAEEILQTQTASDASKAYLRNLMAQPDVLSAISQSELPFFKDFAEFLGQSWVNQTPTATLLAHQDEIANAIVQALQEAFPATATNAPVSPELIEIDTPSQAPSLTDAPAQDDTSSHSSLPNVSASVSQTESIGTHESTLISDSASLALPSDSIPLQESSSAHDTSNVALAAPTSQEISASIADDLTTPEQPVATEFDYINCAANFLRQVILSLPNSALGNQAQSYLQSLLNAPDLLYALASSNHRCLVELASTVDQAKLSQTPIDTLAKSLSDMVGVVAGDLLQHFRSQPSLHSAEEEDGMPFTFSELIPPSSFTSDTPDLDDLVSLSENKSLETLTNPIPLETMPNKMSTPGSEPNFQDAPNADHQNNAVPTNPSPTEDTPSAFEAPLLLDDSIIDESLSLEESPTATLDELKDIPQPDTDLEFPPDELLLPEDDLLLEASSTPQEPVSDTSLTPTLDEASLLDTTQSELSVAPDNSLLTEPSSESTESTLLHLESSTETPLDTLEPASLDTSLANQPDTSLTNQASSSIETSASLETLDELTFDNELLLDESGIEELTETSDTRQDLSQLSLLSDKANLDNSDDLLFSDTLDESLLTDSLLLDDTAIDTPASQTPALETQAQAPSSSEPLLSEESELDFSLDTASLSASSETLSQVSPETVTEGISSNDTFLLNDNLSDLAESAPAPASATSTHAQPSISLDFLKESYESELVPVSDFQLDELQQIFLDEAREYLETLNADMLELDKFADTVQPELVNRVLRGAHTLKGSAAMVNLKNIRDLAHKMEDCLQVVRDNNLKVPRPLLDVCFKSLDAIGIMVENFRRTGEDRFTKAQPLMDLFAAYTQQLQETGTIREDASTTAPPVSSQPTTSQPSTSFQLDELQQIFLDEAREYLETLNADMLELDKFADTVQPELVNRVLRGAHTLKGSAAMVNLKNISELAHKMEDCLQVVRDNNLKVPRPLLDILFQSSDAIGTMLKTFQSTGKDDLDVSGHIAILKDYMAQLQQTGEIKTVKSLEKATAPSEAPTPTKQKAFTEENVRINIRSLNNLVNMSAELVISRNRLTNELAGVTRLINKFLRERSHLAQIHKKVVTTIQKNAGERLDTHTGFSDILREFSETEFDRFSDLDIISRDIRSAMLNLDETINELRSLSSSLAQNVVKVSGIANDLNREIVSMRMVPMNQMYTRFERSFRDIAKIEGKQIIFKTEGADTKLDKSVMEEIVEPVLHMIRNAIGHGIEKPEVRLAHGKPAAGTLTLRAYQKGNRVILEIEDDGGGIPIQKVKAKAVRLGLISQEEADTMPASKATELIFLPGFSTADKITELSGRGVGMDVVKNTIRQLKGTITVETREGKGTKFTISLPITLAINQALLVSASAHTYAIPLEFVLETLSVSSDYLTTDEHGNKIITIRGEEYEFRYFNELLGYSIEPLEYRTMHSIVVIGLPERKVALAVEKLIGKEEIVVKSLGRHLRNVRGVIGATILGDGQVVVILDIEYLLRPASERGEDVHIQALPSLEPEPEEIQPTITKRKRKGARITVLHADDSPSVRKYVQSILKSANIDVISVDDGLNALNRLTQPNSNIDIIVSDLEMPRMNGFEFVTEVRKMEAYKDIPFIIVTARAGDKHRRTGLELGANAFLNKPFDPAQLIETIESYIA